VVDIGVLELAGGAVITAGLSLGLRNLAGIAIDACIGCRSGVVLANRAVVARRVLHIGERASGTLLASSRVDGLAVLA
jgi:hypothetical protein